MSARKEHLKGRCSTYKYLEANDAKEDTEKSNKKREKLTKKK